MMQRSTPIIFPVKVMYVYAVIIVCLFVMGFLWYVMDLVFVAVRGAMLPVMSNYSNHTAYSTFALADTFMANVWKYFLAIMMLGLLLYVIVYSQRKGEVVYQGM